jgi:hypothetical protein
MTETRRNEKPEKIEKEDEKTEEKGRGGNEKNWDEKWRRDPLSATGLALFLMWMGAVLLAENLGYLARIPALESWNLIVLGAGVIVLAIAAIRYLVPSYRRPIGGTLILGIILLASGLSAVMSSGLIWAGALILLGVGLLLRGILRR